MKKRLHIFYSGRVQGVGFRFIVKRVADESGILGWVFNQSDGRVEVLCEGGEEMLYKFIERIKKIMERYIVNVTMSWGEAKGEFEVFRIKV